MLSRRYAALLAAASLCVLPACGDDDEESSEGGGGDSGSSAEARPLDLAISESGKRSTIKLPESVEAGLYEMSFNNGGKAPHSVQLVRVEGDQTAEQVKKATSGDVDGIPEWLHGAGGLGTVPPGQGAKATVLLEPGTYYAQDDESEKGGIAKFEVTGEAADVEVPSTDSTIVADEYTFDASGLKAGENEVTFENAGKELHHVIAFPYAKGATAAQVKKFLSTENSKGKPPVDFEGGTGTAVLDGGATQLAELEFQKGKYALVCFIPDRAGGPPHVAKGMIQEVTVE